MSDDHDPDADDDTPGPARPEADAGDGDDDADPDVEERSAPLGDLADRVEDPPELDAGDDDHSAVGPGGDDDVPAFGAAEEGTPELPGDTEGGRSGPLGDLASRVDDQRALDSEADGEFDELFDEYDDATVDSDALWEQVGADDPFEVETEEVDEPDHRVVDKAKYCQSCRFFSEPPDVACTHQETEILEVRDMDHFEVFNCPIVREDENLENL